MYVNIIITVIKYVYCDGFLSVKKKMVKCSSGYILSEHEHPKSNNVEELSFHVHSNG